MSARRSKTACFCGNSEDEASLFKAVDEAVCEGFEWFLFCGETESGLCFSKQVLLRKKLQKGNKADKIILVCVISNEKHTDNKDEEFRNKYFELLADTDYCIDLKSNDDYCCEKFIISRSSKIISAENSKFNI